MLPSDDAIATRFDSLDELFRALALRQPAATMSTCGGYVRVHPDMFSEDRLRDRLAFRQRVEHFGLRLVISRAVGPRELELCPSRSSSASRAD